MTRGKKSITLCVTLGLILGILIITDSENESKFRDTDASDIILNEDVIINHTFHFCQGWNPLTIPAVHNWTAETMGQNITGCTLVLRYNNIVETIEIHVVGTLHNNFPIENGVGYFVFVIKSTTFTVTGIEPTTVSVPIRQGWSLIGWFHPYNTTAGSLGENITGTVMVTMIIIDCETPPPHPPPALITHIVGIPWDNFTIKTGEAVFIYTTLSSWWNGEG